MLADLVIIDAPPVESVEGQVVCSAADRSLLVVEEGETRARDASAALDALAQAGGTALGVVLVRNPSQLVDPGFLAERSWSPVRLPAGPSVPQARPAPAGGPGGPGGPGAPAGQPGPGRPAQVPPADRTAPISREKLEEAAARAPARRSGGWCRGRPAWAARTVPGPTAPQPTTHRGAQRDRPAASGGPGGRRDRPRGSRHGPSTVRRRRGRAGTQPAVRTSEPPPERGRPRPRSPRRPASPAGPCPDGKPSDRFGGAQGGTNPARAAARSGARAPRRRSSRRPANRPPGRG